VDELLKRFVGREGVLALLVKQYGPEDATYRVGSWVRGR
jgi:hypothetical protein